MQLPQVGRVLPGPAGKLQELAAAGALQQATPELLGLKASSTAGISPSQAANQNDAAFLSSSWAAAKARAEEDAVTAGPVRSVSSAKELGLGKVPRMLLLLSSFHPSGAGSAFSKVKDPSGTMGAAIHASALQQQPLLGPGCVMLLQDVSVLTPHPGSCYLAVTAGNIVQVWGPDQQPRSIRNAAHQPAGTQHPQQQQQHAPEQQQHPRQQLPQRTTQLQQPPQQTQQHIQHPQQQQPGQFLKGRPQPRPGTAAAAAAAQSGADSRHSGSFFEPPSPDVMSVLNQLSGRGPGPAAAAAAAGNRSTAGGILPHQQQRQQQQVWPQQGREQQGEVSPALSGAAMPPVRRQTGLGSMPPPPPRAPAIAAGAAGGHHASQQQQRLQHNSQQQQPWLAQNSHQQQWPHPSSPQQQPWLQPSSQEQHQHPAGSGGPAQYVKPPLQQQGQGQSLFQGLSQPNAVTPGPPSSSQTLNPGSARVGTGSQVAGAWPGSSRQQGGVAGAAAAAGGCGIGSRGLPARPSTAAALDEEDVEVDQNLVSAIFGSQVPRAQPPLPIATQQQQQGAAVSGALTGSLGRAHAPPAAAGVKPALSAISSLGSKHQQGAMLPPANKVPAQQQWGMQQQQQQAGGVSGGVLGKGGVSGGVLRRGGAGVLGGSLLGKRSAQLSLLDDLVAGDLDDF